LLIKEQQYEQATGQVKPRGTARLTGD